MAKPTEPGYYWLNETGNWAIVQVEEGVFESAGQLFVFHNGWGQECPLGCYDDNAWGGRITQEPVPDLPPPF